MNLVMLDIDGTLIQSYEYDRDVFGAVIGEVLGGLSVDADLNGYMNKTSLGVTEEAIRSATGRNPEEREIEEVKYKVMARFEKMSREFPNLFSQVPGAAGFLERLRGLEGAGIAIATGCWLEEARFKLRASGLSIDGLPIATSSDDRNRIRIMTQATEKARQSYGCAGFERTVYFGDGPWDLQASHSLGYEFIGIGPRVQELKETGSIHWHPDFLDLRAVFDSIAAVFHR
jgi:phosphoglycolate phosphatase-like HAD superfamily hydrolase